jgi:nucleotide-binding universal stress UspA family protein
MGEADAGDRTGGIARSGPGTSKAVLYPTWESAPGNSFDVATAIAETYGARLVVARAEAADTGGSESLRARAERELPVPVDDEVLPSGRRVEAVSRAVTGHDVDVVVLPEGGGSGTDGRVARRTGCDVLTVTTEYRLPTISSVLAPVAGGEHSGGVVDVAGALASAHDAWVELLYVRPGSGAHGARLLERASRRLAAVEVDSRVVEGRPVADTICEESDYYDVSVVGAPQKGRLRQFVFGSTTRAVERDANNVVVTVRRRPDRAQSLFSGPLR